MCLLFLFWLWDLDGCGWVFIVLLLCFLGCWLILVYFDLIWVVGLGNVYLGVFMVVWILLVYSLGFIVSYFIWVCFSFGLVAGWCFTWLICFSLVLVLLVCDCVLFSLRFWLNVGLWLICLYPVLCVLIWVKHLSFLFYFGDWRGIIDCLVFC